MDASGIILALFAVAVIVGLIVHLYTRRGSGIETRPHDGRGDAEGAKGPSSVSGHDEGEGSPLDDRGTR